MIIRLLSFFTIWVLLVITANAQTNEWATDYAVFDDAVNGTGDQTPSVAIVGPNRFIALVTETPDEPVLDNMWDPPGNYLVGYWDADSALGRVVSPINGEQTIPEYGGTAKFTDWTSGLDVVTLKGAWQLAGGADNYVYVANNDETHNILVFELTADGVVATDFRMETGMENIYSIEVDDSGFVYVCDFEGRDDKDSEVRVYAGINAPGTTWGDFVGHNDSPTATIDLPPGQYQGMTVSGDGTALFISATSERSLWKYVGDPESGYTRDDSFEYTLAADDTVSDGGDGTPSLLGLGYLNDPPIVFAAVDTFIHIGLSGGYPYGRIYLVNPADGTPLDTIDIAQWNLAVTGEFNTGSDNGRAGGFTSVVDVDVESSDSTVYTQTYYGWAVEKWVFDGDLGDFLVGIEQLTSIVPENFSLKQNYPNPFNPSTTIEFDLLSTEHVTLAVYNPLGQKVAVLVNGRLAPGTYQATFDASALASGVYLYRLTAGKFESVKKMILMK